jgi:serine/threonine-protein kinase
VSDALPFSGTNPPPDPERTVPASDLAPLPKVGPGPAAASQRYELSGEIARGGMGAVLRGRDRILGRELAVKVLLEAHEGRPELARRFVEEAQVGGQLQHPGIVPVYELGNFDDGRPFFTMKLLEGRTLADLLHERADAQHDLPRFLKVFETVCQTVAYAHSKGVIHRDLKPANIMVGAFGEVQVMDWGLAKVLGATACGQPPAVRTLYSASEGQSQYGEFLGTPAFVAPEQARGEIDKLDERGDVFGLGAILCVILTGEPPFVGGQAQRAELDDAFARLAGCGADADLVALCRECLAPAPEGRPRDGQAVASAVTAYLSGVQEKLRLAELARAAAQARAVEERKRRRLTVALAGVVLLVVVLVGGGWAWFVYQRQDRRAQTARAVGKDMEESIALRERAKAAPPGDLTAWAAALAAAKRAEEHLADRDGNEALRQQVLAYVAELAREVKERRLVARLEDAQWATEGKGGHFNPSGPRRLYEKAFQDFGLDVLGRPAAEVAAEVRVSMVQREAVRALDHWADLMRDDAKKQRHLREVVRLADPNRTRQRLREALEKKDRPMLLKLAAEPSAALEERELSRLAQGLAHLGAWPEAQALLRKAVQKRPDSPGANSELGLFLLIELEQIDEAIRFLTIAAALRGRNSMILCNLAEALLQRSRPEDIDEAIEVCERALKHQGTDNRSEITLAKALLRRGGPADLDRAITVLRHDPSPQLVSALARRGRPKDIDDAIAICERPDWKDDFWAQHTLGVLFLKRGRPGDLDKAVRATSEAVRLEPTNAGALSNMVIALARRGRPEDLDRAIRDGYEVIKLQPRLQAGYTNLGMALRRRNRAGDLDKAIWAFRLATRFGPSGRKHLIAQAIAAQGFVLPGAASPIIPQTIVPLGVAVFDASALDPSNARTFINLGGALEARGGANDLADAVTAYRLAVVANRGLPNAHCALGLALQRQGKFAEALRALREGDRLGGLRPESKDWVRNCERLLDLDRNQAGYTNLGVALMRRNRAGDLDKAIWAFRLATRFGPSWRTRLIAQAIAAQGFALPGAASPIIPQTIVPLGVAVFDASALDPSNASTFMDLGSALEARGGANDLADAVTAYRLAVVANRGLPNAHCALGLALQRQGKFAEALRALREGDRLGALRPESKDWVRSCERLLDLDRLLPAVLRREYVPRSPAERVEFALLCQNHKELYAESARLFKEAFLTTPALANDLKALYRYNAACAAARAGVGQGKDAAELDDVACARWRSQARTWLQDDLALCARRLKEATPSSREEAVRWLRLAQQDSDFAGLRDEGALARLPAVEREAWRRLWAHVAALLAEATHNK